MVKVYGVMFFGVLCIKEVENVICVLFLMSVSVVVLVICCVIGGVVVLWLLLMFFVVVFLLLEFVNIIVF